MIKALTIIACMMLITPSTFAAPAKQPLKATGTGGNIPETASPARQYMPSHRAGPSTKYRSYKRRAPTTRLTPSHRHRVSERIRHKSRPATVHEQKLRSRTTPRTRHRIKPYIEQPVAKHKHSVSERLRHKSRPATVEPEPTYQTSTTPRHRQRTPTAHPKHKAHPTMKHRHQHKHRHKHRTRHHIIYPLPSLFLPYHDTRWVRVKWGFIPANAVLLYYHPDGYFVYSCRAEYEGEIYKGTVRDGEPCYIEVDGETIAVPDDFMVLVE